MRQERNRTGEGSAPEDLRSRPYDRPLLRRRRARVARRAGDVDFLLRRVADDLAERLEIVQRSFPMAANLGAHHGVLSRRLRELSSVGLMVDVESVPELLAQCDGPPVLADEEALPFADASLDLVVSALALHHVNDLPGTLLQIRRALKPDGLFLAALLGGSTLAELGEAWLIAEEEITGGASPRVAPSIEVRDLGGLLQRAGFALPVVDSETVRVAYANPLELMRDIKAMGASNVLNARRRVPARRDCLVRAAEIYAERHARADGRILATFEILSVTAWAPDPSQQKPLKPGSASMRLADALGTKEYPAEPGPATARSSRETDTE
ncbi:MAG: methyltransferase domain-containing protein [Hyphomicrobiaceae bacterium]|nr:methyltransferase domain-containing protein [Hyphomicrobiaceae bacterium]